MKAKCKKQQINALGISNYELLFLLHKLIFQN